MKTRLKNKHAMYNTVIAVCDLNPGIVSTVPAFDRIVKSLKVKNALLEDYIRQLLINTEGIAEEKSFLKKQLCDKACRIAAAISAYAHENGNLVLYKEMHFTESVMIRERAELMAEKCLLILERLSSMLVPLADYGISAADQTELETLINQFLSKIPASTIAREHKKTINARMKQLAKEIDSLLKKEFDKIALLLEEDQPVFYEDLVNARMIYDLHGKQNKQAADEKYGMLYVTLTDAEGEPIEGALVSLEGTGLELETDAEGEAYFEKVAIGQYTIKAVKEGYEPVSEANVAVADDDELSKDFIMIKAEGGQSNAA